MCTVGLYTLGCKVSQYETEAVSEAFSDAGFSVKSFGEVCDVYVINTCTVTEESDRKSRQFIHRAERKNPNAHVIVMGCYSERSADEVLALPSVSAVIGTHGKLECVDIARRLISGELSGRGHNLKKELDGAPFEKMSVRSSPRTRAYVKIEDGCNSKCSYCAIKEARGKIRSKLPEDVIREVEALASSGAREVVLTGIETAAYGADFDEKYTLADLLETLDRRRSCERIRLGSLAPELIGEEFARRISGLKILVPHFHISVQSGSDSVLAAMRRRYTARTALENIERIRALVPGATFTADIMVGFPSESEEDFLESCAFVTKARLLSAHVFSFSAREGTVAAEMEDISKSVKKRRNARLTEVVRATRDSVLDGIVGDGETLSCIFETEVRPGLYSAHSDTFLEVVAESEADVKGELLDVAPIRHENGVIYGKIL